MSDWVVRSLVRGLTSNRGMSLLTWYQDRLLRKTLWYASQHSPFYRRRFAKLGLSPNVVRRQEDLPALRFFTTGEDIQAGPFDFLAVPKDKVVHIMSTAGVTGKPKLTFYSKRDWEDMVRMIATGFTLVGIGEKETAQVMFSSGTPTWMGASLLQAGLERRGCFIVRMGNALSAEDQLEAMATFGTTYLFGTPSYLHRVTEEGKKLRDLTSLGIKGIYLGAEPNSKAFRDYLRGAWNAEVYNGYGMMELGAGVAGECPEQNGLHLNLYVIVEVVDPDTGEPLEVGEEGELVFTTLKREATPLIRYRSGDVARLLPDAPCPCDLFPTRRISNILGRTDDMVFLGTGENLYPLQLDRAMVTIPEVSGYQMVIGKDGYKDTLLLKIETTSPSPELVAEVKDSLYREIPFIRHDVFESQTLVEPLVNFLKPGTLQEENSIKVRKVVDTREREKKDGTVHSG